MAVVPKLKLSMSHGTTDRAITVADPVWLELGAALAGALRPLGGIDVDVILTPTGPVVLDINPRLGGGFPFTGVACPEYVAALLRLAAGDEVAPFVGRYEANCEAHREYRYFRVPGR